MFNKRIKMLRVVICSWDPNGWQMTNFLMFFFHRWKNLSGLRKAVTRLLVTPVHYHFKKAFANFYIHYSKSPHFYSRSLLSIYVVFIYKDLDIIIKVQIIMYVVPSYCVALNNIKISWSSLERRIHLAASYTKSSRDLIVSR